MRRFRAGDTLIEVLFAFAILATIMGFTFTAAIQGYKNAVQAQNQTQATFLAQYQADALKTYRDSLDWDNPATQSFISGFSSPSPTIPSLPAMRGYINGDTAFCMRATLPGGTGLIRWETITNTADCNSDIAGLAPSLPGARVSIVFSNPQFFNGTRFQDSTNNGPIDKVTATVTITYDIPNADADGQVINTITLTREN